MEPIWSRRFSQKCVQFFPYQGPGVDIMKPLRAAIFELDLTCPKSRWGPLVARDAAVLCVAGVALGDIYRRFAWHAWHLATSTFVSGGRPGTYGGWRVWCPLVARDAAALCVASTVTLHGRRGTWRNRPSFAMVVAPLFRFRGFVCSCCPGVCGEHVHRRT